MADDPRTALDVAARERLAFQIRAGDGAWIAGHFVRVDKAGVVVVVDEPAFSGGEDVKIWFAGEDGTRSFEASILRVGVPVPDRSQNGLMLGFIDGWKETGEAETKAPEVRLVVVPPNGRGLDLVGGLAQIVELDVGGLSFTVPATEALKFIEEGTVRMRFERPGHDPHWATGRVRSLSSGEGHYLYSVRFTEQDDESGHLQAIEALRGQL